MPIFTNSSKQSEFTGVFCYTNLLWRVREFMISKKRYVFGIFLLIIACVLMQLFAKSAERIRLFYYVLEYLGIYNGYRLTLINKAIWVIVTIAMVTLMSISFHLMWNSFRAFAMKDRYKAIPILILIISLISCFMFLHIHRYLLHYQGGLHGIILDRRQNVRYLESIDMEGNLEYMALDIELQKFSIDGDEAFGLKLVDLNDNSNEYIFMNNMRMGEAIQQYERGIGRYTFSVRSLGLKVENIPGYDPKTDNYKDLRFKLIIYNEKESKTFLFYFDPS